MTKGKIYTIELESKTAEQFFTMIKNAGVTKLINLRLNNTSKQSGFCNLADLAYFARTICNIGVEQWIAPTPTMDLLDKHMDLSGEYKNEYLKLLDDMFFTAEFEILDLNNCCFLYSDYLPDFCHRLILTEYLHLINKEVEIIHLV